MIARIMTLIIASLFSASILAMSHEEEEEQTQASKDKLPEFAKADANDDGILTWKEAKAVGIAKDTFKQGDYDDNGEVSQTIYEYSLQS